MKKAILLIFVFLIINFMVLGMNSLFQPFHSLEMISIPIENNVIIFSYLVLNYTVTLILVIAITKSLNDLFEMYPYILSRNNSSKVAVIYFKRNLKTILFIIIVKLIVDLLCGQVDGFQRFDILIKLYTSTIITSLIWSLIITILFFIFQNQKKVLFTSLILIYICQYFALIFKPFMIITIAGTDFYSNFTIIIISKIILLFILFILSIYLFKNVEVLGGEKND